MIQLTDLCGRICCLQLRKSRKYSEAEREHNRKQHACEALRQHVTSECIELQPPSEDQLVGLRKHCTHSRDGPHSRCKPPQSLQTFISKPRSLLTGDRSPHNDCAGCSRCEADEELPPKECL